MWPFNRRKKQQNGKVPAEVQQYYNKEHRERIWLAWLIAFVSLVVTIGIILALFFGGRWVYRQITNNDDNGTTSQPADTSQPPDALPSPTDNGSGETEHEDGDDHSEGEASGSEDENTAPQTSTGTQNGSDQKLTDTGPGEVVSVFVAVTIIATLGHLAYTKYRLNNS